MIAVVDYGVGNLFSVCNALRALGVESVVTGDPRALLEADRVILPGVGAFGEAMARLRETGLDGTVQQIAARGTPLLGICLGMQLLFDEGLEFGRHRGLGLLRGSVIPLPEDPLLKTPHMGWNQLRALQSHPLMRHCGDSPYVYFVHSYYAADCQSVVADAPYGVDVPGIVAHGHVAGCQFHPEKSGEAGLGILRAFCEWGF